MPIGRGGVGQPGALGVPGDRFLKTRPFRSARLNQTVGVEQSAQASISVTAVVATVSASPTQLLAGTSQMNGAATVSPAATVLLQGAAALNGAGIVVASGSL